MYIIYIGAGICDILNISWLESVNIVVVVTSNVYVLMGHRPTPWSWAVDETDHVNIASDSLSCPNTTIVLGGKTDWEG